MATSSLIPGSKHFHRFALLSEFTGRQYGGGNSKRKKSPDGKDDRPSPQAPKYSSIPLLTENEKDFDKTQWERSIWIVESGSDDSQGSDQPQSQAARTQPDVRQSKNSATKKKVGCQFGVFIIFFCEFLMLSALDIVLWFFIVDELPLNHFLAAIAIAVAAICPFCASSIEICRRCKKLGDEWTRAQIILQMGLLLLGLTGCILLFVPI